MRQVLLTLQGTPFPLPTEVIHHYHTYPSPHLRAAAMVYVNGYGYSVSVDAILRH